MKDIIAYLGIGGLGAVLILVIAEIVKLLFKFKQIEIKNPLTYIRDEINKPVITMLTEVQQNQKDLKLEFDEHVAQAYRNKIFNFQDKLIHRGITGHSMEEWDEVIEACDKYEAFVDENHIENGKCKRAIGYIKRSYQKCEDIGGFNDELTDDTNDTDNKQ